MRKFLFLPHCLRNINTCVAVIDGNGYQCASCGGCKINQIMEVAREENITVFIAPGGSLVKKIFQQQRVTDEDLVLGVACETELKDLKSSFIKDRFKSKNKVAIKLLKDGCINTDLNLEELIGLMRGNGI